MGQVIAKMRSADVIVLATPVYFYIMCAQMKTMIERTLGCVVTSNVCREQKRWGKASADINHDKK